MPRKAAASLPKISVIMPVYNAAAYLPQAIESVLAQAGPTFELLAADDRSTDGSFEILRRYSRDSRVRIFRNRRNKGSGATRNFLLRQARAEYVTPCDADDLLLPRNLSRLCSVLDEAPEIGMVYGDILAIEIQRGRMLEFPQIVAKDHTRTWDLIEDTVNHGGCMMRRPLTLAVGGYDEGAGSLDDKSLWLKMSETTQYRYLAGEIYYLWRRHSKGQTRTDKNAPETMWRLVSEAGERRLRKQR